MNFSEVAAQLMTSSIMQQTTWDKETLAAWLRDGFRCVYCGYDMLQSYDITYHYSSRDHLLPASLYAELIKSQWNRVLCCKGCNVFKTDWDPNYDGIYVRGSSIIMEETRQQLLIRAKGFVESKRMARCELFKSEQALIRSALEGDGRSLTAGAP